MVADEVQQGDVGDPDGTWTFMADELLKKSGGLKAFQKHKKNKSEKIKARAFELGKNEAWWVGWRNQRRSLRHGCSRCRQTGISHVPRRKELML